MKVLVGNPGYSICMASKITLIWLLFGLTFNWATFFLSFSKSYKFTHTCFCHYTYIYIARHSDQVVISVSIPSAHQSEFLKQCYQNSRNLGIVAAFTSCKSATCDSYFHRLSPAINYFHSAETNVTDLNCPSNML